MSKLFGNISTRPLVLAVDDSVENLQVLSAILKDDYQVKVAKNGQKALEIAGNFPHPDLILLDVMMPVLDGMSTLKALRYLTNPDLANIPVIMVTAHAMTGDRERFLAAGANGYVSKPIGFEALEDEIQRLALQPPHPH